MMTDQTQIHPDHNPGRAPHIRPMTADDVARLADLDANFQSPIYLDLIKEVNGLNISWRLVERPFATPFVCTDFDFDEQERSKVAGRLATGDGLWLVAEIPGGKGLVGMVDVALESWRDAAWVWNIAVHRPYRGRGLGRELMERVIAWGRRQGLRAIILESQTNNWPACRFYQHFGFKLSGIDDHYYTNRDIENKEVAIFWTYEL